MSIKCDKEKILSLTVSQLNDSIVLSFRTPAVPNLAANFYDFDDSVYGNEVSH